MKWVFVLGGVAMVIIGGIGKYVDITKYHEKFISGNSPWYTVFMTGVIAVILGLSFDWIMSLDDEEEEGEGVEGEPPSDKEEAGEDAGVDEPGPADDESAEGDAAGQEPKDGGEQPPAESADDDGPQ